MPTENDRKTRVVISATFAVDELDAALQSWVKIVGGNFFDWAYSPYGSLMPGLESGVSPLTAVGAACNVILVRFHDLCPGIRHPEQRHKVLTKQVQSTARPAAPSIGSLRAGMGTFADALCEYEKHAQAPPALIFCCPAPPWELEEASRRAELAALEEELVTRLASTLSKVKIVRSGALLSGIAVRKGRERAWFTEKGERLAHSPYTPILYEAVAHHTMRHLHALAASTRKVIAVDCDNTLWGGAVGEVGAAGVDLSEPWRKCQEVLVGLQERGLLVCLCSRNREEDVREVFETRREEMPLSLEKHVIALAVNWVAKSTNLESLARQLSLGIDSFLFLDDSPLECAEVCRIRAHMSLYGNNH